MICIIDVCLLVVSKSHVTHTQTGNWHIALSQHFEWYTFGLCVGADAMTSVSC